MTHIMVDLETLSTRTNAAIIAIGAVKFDVERRVYDKFYRAVALPCDLRLEDLLLDVDDDWDGFHVSADTVLWWTKQDKAARAVFTDPAAVPVQEALLMFANWATRNAAAKTIKLWGNGAAFDNAILSTAYDLCRMIQPWMFYNDRCYRTIKAQHPDVPLARIGTYHNAVNDAESQAAHLLAMHARLD